MRLLADYHLCLVLEVCCGIVVLVESVCIYVLLDTVLFDAGLDDLFETAFSIVVLW